MSVSEEMHQRAREEQQVRQNAEHMRSVLGEKKEACNEQEADKYPVANRRRRAAVRKMVIQHPAGRSVARLARAVLGDRLPDGVVFHH